MRNRVQRSEPLAITPTLYAQLKNSSVEFSVRDTQSRSLPRCWTQQTFRSEAASQGLRQSTPKYQSNEITKGLMIISQCSPLGHPVSANTTMGKSSSEYTIIQKYKSQNVQCTNAKKDNFIDGQLTDYYRQKERTNSHETQNAHGCRRLRQSTIR